MTRSRKAFLMATVSLFVGMAQPVSLMAADALTRSNGAPVGDNQDSLTAGPVGPTLLQDNYLIEKLASFDRERIPERVVHARGTGAFGVFKATADLADLTRAAPFQKAGKETPVFVRFSSVINSKGSPEELRDPHGFAVKFYTDQGNWDLVGNNFPVFFIRDAIKFPDMVHSLKPDPKTNVQDANRYFDFFSHQPESTQMLTLLYSPLGIPASFTQMNGSGVHAFKFVNAQCQVKYVKFTWFSHQGNKGMTPAQAGEEMKKDFNNLTDDLYHRIDSGQFPVWDLFIQTMDTDKLDSFDFNPLDTTKQWPPEIAPLRKVGELTLNKVPDNFFQSTEESAFAPSNLIPGIEPSEDRMLQGRLFSYADTQRYRLGVNNMMIPVNAPKAPVHNDERDGLGNFAHQQGSINYQPSSMDGNLVDDPQYKACQRKLSGTTTQVPFAKTQNFKQAGDLFRSYSPDDREQTIEALGDDLKTVKSADTRNTIASFMYKADADYGTGVAKRAGIDLDQVKALAAKLQD